MNNNFKQQLQRYIDGELDTIYEELPKMAMNPPIKRHQHQPEHQQHQYQHENQQLQQLQQLQQQQQLQQKHLEQQQLQQQKLQQQQQEYYYEKQIPNTMHHVYNPYDDEPHDFYGVEHIDRHNNENIKKLSVELAEKILKTQTKVDYYKAMKKKASIKLEEHLKRKDEDCEPLIHLMLSSKLENVTHEGHKLSVVNGKNKRYIKITKLK